MGLRDAIQDSNALKYMIIAGLGVALTCSFISTYDTIANTTKYEKECKEGNSYKKILQNRFIVFMVMFTITMVVSLGTTVLFGKIKPMDGPFFISLMLLSSSTVGFIYTLINKYDNTRPTFSAVMSYILFFIFLVLVLVGKAYSFDD